MHTRCGREALAAPARESNRMVRLVRRTALAVIAVAAAVCPVAAGGSRSPSPARGKLVLVGDFGRYADDVHEGLYVINVDGSGLRQIAHSSSDGEPHWSPDGRLIAFVHRSTYDDVVVVRADGSGERVLGTTLDTSLGADPWSPDGKRIAWGGCGGLCVLDLRSMRRTAIALSDDDTDSTDGFSWSPDGRKLVAVDADRRLVVVDAAGGIIRILAAQGEAPAWSPDGREIAFLDQDKLELVPAAGGRSRVAARDASSATWSPDGRRLLVTGITRRSAIPSVRVLNVVTHAVRKIDDASGGMARWSPDGSMIAFGRLPTRPERARTCGLRTRPAASGS